MPCDDYTVLTIKVCVCVLWVKAACTNMNCVVYTTSPAGG